MRPEVNRALPFALAGLLLLAGIATFLLGRSRAADARERVAPVREATPKLEAPGELVTSDAPASTRAPETPALPPATEVVPAAPLPGMRRLAGRLVLPETMPIDEKVALLAAANSPPGIEYRAEVDRDGRYVLEVPEKWRQAWFRLEAKYLYLDDRTEAVKRALDVALVLEPKLGGCIEFEVAPTSPAAVPLDHWIGRKVGLDAREQTSPGRYSSVFGRKRTIGDDLRCSFGGLPASWTYEASWQRGALWFQADGERPIRAGETLRVEMPAFAEARIRGSLLDEAGSTVPKPEWRFSWKSDVLRGERIERWAAAACDTNGLFDIDGLPPGELEVQIRKDEFLPVCWNSGPLREGEDRRGVALVLRKGLCILGQVKHSDGKPASKCVVQLTTEDRGRPWSPCNPDGSQERVTDSEGAFTCCGLNSGPWTVEARTDLIPRSSFSSRPMDPASAASARKEGVACGAGPVLLVLDDGIAITGSVVDDQGQPVPRFQLRVLPWKDGLSPDGSWQDVRPRKFDSPTGEFEIPGLRPGRWGLGLEAQGFGAQTIGPITIPASLPLRLVVARPAALRGRVLDPMGQPARNARVHIDRFAPESLTRSDDSNERGIPVKDDGSFAIERVPPGTQMIWATAPETAGSTRTTLELGPSAGVADVMLQLRAGGTILGSVFDEQGKPAVGWRVMCGRFAMDFPEPITTDGRGEFVRSHLAPGTYHLNASPPNERRSKDWPGDSGRTWVAETEVADEEAHRVALGEPRSASARIEGRVTRTDVGLAGAFVFAHAQGPGKARKTTTDEAGNYVLDIHWTGATTISVRSSLGRWDSSSRQVQVEPGRSLRADFAVASGSVRGRVLDPEGKPVEKASVTLVTSDRLSREQYVSSLLTGSDGAFVFEGVPAGRFDLKASGPSFSSSGGSVSNRRPAWPELKQAIDVVDGQPLGGLELRFRPGGVITGTVFGPHGLRVPDARLGAFNSLGQSMDEEAAFAWGNTRTDDQGRFEVTSVPSGDLQIIAMTDFLICTPVPLHVHEGETLDVRLDLAQGTRLLLRSSGNSDMNFAWDRVFEVRDPNGHEWVSMLGGDSDFAPADDGGGPGTRLGPLPRGRYSLAFHDPFLGNASMELLVGEAGLLPVDVPAPR